MKNKINFQFWKPNTLQMPSNALFFLSNLKQQEAVIHLRQSLMEWPKPQGFHGPKKVAL
jgi:hypothetical protein